MTPTEKCVTRETAERLKAKGFPQDTERWWCAPESPERWSLFKTDKPENIGNLGYYVAAPDVHEIAEVMKAFETRAIWSPSRNLYSVMLYPQGEVFYGLNQAENYAGLWLWLKEQNRSA